MAQAAAIYARFSSHNQREESIDDQVRVCRAQAASDGCPVVAVYADHAISGTTDRRPEFLRMVADAGKGRFDRLYVYKLDRFARNRFDSATYRAKLRKAGVDVVSASERVPDGPEGIMLESVLEGMAECYSANLSQNIRRGMEGNAMQCRSNGARFYGYRSEGGRYVVARTRRWWCAARSARSRAVRRCPRCAAASTRTGSGRGAARSGASRRCRRCCAATAT